RLSKVQAESYRVGAEIARVEQQVQHQRELKSRLERARAETEAQFAELGQHISGDERQLDALNAAIAEHTPRVEGLREEEEAKQEALREAEAALADWQARWDAYARAQAEATRG